MASSSKVQFNLGTLKTQALEAVQSRIDRAAGDIESMRDDEAFAAAVQGWRDSQESRVSDLFRRLGGNDISNSEFAEFEIDPMPRRDEALIRRTEASLRRLEDLRDQIEAKANSLVPDEDGNISLTKTQLAEFFGL